MCFATLRLLGKGHLTDAGRFDEPPWVRRRLDDERSRIDDSHNDRPGDERQVRGRSAGISGKYSRFRRTGTRCAILYRRDRTLGSK